MTDVEVLRPRNGHYVHLVTLMVGIFAMVVTVAFFLNDVYHGRLNQSRPLIVLVAILVIPIGIMYFRTGRFVIIDSAEGISKPTIFRKSKQRMIPLDAIESYSKIFSMDSDTSVIGVLVRTTRRERIRYLDPQTPECSARILSLLHERGVREIVPNKKLWA